MRSDDEFILRNTGSITIKISTYVTGSRFRILKIASLELYYLKSFA